MAWVRREAKHRKELSSKIFARMYDDTFCLIDVSMY